MLSFLILVLNVNYTSLLGKLFTTCNIFCLNFLQYTLWVSDSSNPLSSLCNIEISILPLSDSMYMFFLFSQITTHANQILWLFKTIVNKSFIFLFQLLECLCYINIGIIPLLYYFIHVLMNWFLHIISYLMLTIFNLNKDKT